MKNRKMLLQVLLSMALVLSLVVPASVLNMASVMAQGPATPMVAAGGYHTVGLKSDGTVVAVGWNEYGQCEVGGWTGIIQVAAGFGHTVGVKNDGTVVAAGDNEYGQCEVGGWTDITWVAAGDYQTVGLKSDGTMVAVGDNFAGQCDIGGWSDITQVAAGFRHTVGVKADGTVVAVGYNYYGQCDVGNWTGITQVTGGGYHTVGLKDDGTVVAVGWNAEGQCDVGGWTGIAQVAAGSRYTVGVKDDGTVVAAGWNSAGQCTVGGWTDIVQVAAATGGEHTVGLETDGTVVAVGANYNGGCNVGSWNLVLAVPPSQCILTISSTAGGSVTTPGERVFTYDASTVVNLVAEPEEGYRFVNWTGDVDTIADVEAAATNITMDDSYSITANFVGVEAGDVGIKAGDWIKFEYKISGWPAGIPRPEWVKLEFLSVEGTTANVRTTTRWSDGTEYSDTMPVDLAAGGGEILGPAGSLISANLTTGDSVYITGFGGVAIEGETTRTYAGASRTVVYASISQDEAQYTYHWDKLTGVMVEVSVMTATVKATETNMWEATTAGMPWWPWIIVAAAVVALVIVVYRLKKRKTPTAPTPPTEGT